MAASGAAPQPAGPGPAWLLGFCVARGGFAMVQTTYAAVLPVVSRAWGMSGSEAGLVASSYYVGFLVSLFAVGLLADRWGARRTYLASSLVAAASALLFAAGARSFPSALVLHGVMGLCSGGSYTPGLNLLAQRYAPRRRGRAIGFYLAASSAGYAVSLLLSSLMLRVADWQAALWVTCSGPTLAMVLGALMLRHVPNRVEARRLEPRSRAAGEASAESAPPRPAPGVMEAVVRNRPAMLMVWGYVAHAWEMLGVWSWIPAFLAVAYGAGTDPAGSSLGVAFSALTFGVSTTGPMLGGYLSDRWGRTRVVLLLSGLSVACTLALGWLVGAPFWLVVGVAMVLQFAAVADSPVLSTGLTELVHPAWLGTAYSLRSVLGFAAGAVSPWVFGVVLDASGQGAAGAGPLGWGLAFAVLGAGGLLAPACMLWLRRLPARAHLAGGRG